MHASKCDWGGSKNVLPYALTFYFCVLYKSQNACSAKTSSNDNYDKLKTRYILAKEMEVDSLR